MTVHESYRQLHACSPEAQRDAYDTYLELFKRELGQCEMARRRLSETRDGMIGGKQGKDEDCA